MLIRQTGTENETNMQRLFGVPNTSLYVKDGIDEYIVHGRQDAVNPAQQGTKAAAHCHFSRRAGKFLDRTEQEPGS